MPDRSDDFPGPNPSTLEAHDHYPAGINPMTLRVTYTDSKLSDYVGLNRSDGQVCIELGPPLFDIVRKAGKLNNLKNELAEALAAIGLSDIRTHFFETVMDYARELLPQEILPASGGLVAATYVLKKLWDANKLILGYIHHASIDELPSWMGLVEEEKNNADISVNSVDTIS